MNFLELAKARVSCRSYSGAPVSKESVMSVMEAGRLAPSARNRQNWAFYYAQIGDRAENFIEACYGQKFVGQAHGFIAVCDKTDDYVMKCGQNAGSVDCSIAMTFMIMRATEIGLGTCWLGRFSPERVKSLLDIPESYAVVACSTIGHPAGETPRQPRKELSEVFDLRS
ncbi:MAG: nitroreductase family protein [Synergistaceae bacterium]|nr:nitroreductase family protein [Synergistaceae bacterium]